MFSPKSRSLLSALAPPPLPPSPLESASGEFWREYSRLRELQQQTDGVNSLVWARSSDRAARYARERVARLTQEERKKRDDRIAAEEARLRSEEDAKALAAYQAAEERRVAEEDAVRKAVLEAEVARRLAEEAALALALVAKKREEEEEALARVMAEENERKAELAARKKGEAEAEVAALAELRHKAEEKAEMERVLKAEAFRVEEAKARVAMEANISKPDKPALQSVVDNSNVSKSLSNHVVTLVYAAEKTDTHRCDNIMVSAMKHEESNSFKHNADEESALLLINLGKKTSLSPPVVCSSPKTLRNSWSSVLTPDTEIVTRSPINVRLPSEIFDYEVNDYLPLILERSMTPISFHLHSQTA